MKITKKDMQQVMAILKRAKRGKDPASRREAWLAIQRTYLDARNDRQKSPEQGRRLLEELGAAVLSHLIHYPPEEADAHQAED